MTCGPDAHEIRRTTATDAISDLAVLRSSDPAAAAAMRAIRLTRLTLEEFWLPTLGAADPHDCEPAVRGPDDEPDDGG